MKRHYFQRHDKSSNIFVGELFLKEVLQRKPDLTMEYAHQAYRQRTVYYLKLPATKEQSIQVIFLTTCSWGNTVV
jgi:hypothetical protein